MQGFPRDEVGLNVIAIGLGMPSHAGWALAHLAGSRVVDGKVGLSPPYGLELEALQMAFGKPGYGARKAIDGSLKAIDGFQCESNGARNAIDGLWKAIDGSRKAIDGMGEPGAWDSELDRWGSAIHQWGSM